MKKEKIKVYLYTRVSTTMQIDGYSLDAQKTKMKAFCDYNEYEMEGRMQKAREGKWNGSFAPYGYSLIDGKLEVKEEEAVAIRMIFDQYVNTDLGANGIAKYLENHGIHKIARQNGKNPLFDAALIRRIIQNPVYSGKISYGRRRTEKVHGARNEYRPVKKDDYLLVDGLHEACRYLCLRCWNVWQQVY